MFQVSDRWCWISIRCVLILPKRQCKRNYRDLTGCVQQTCHNLHVDVMRSIALGLGLEEHFFEDKINDQCHNLRLLSYPPVERALLQGEGQARAGVHSGEYTLKLFLSSLTWVFNRLRDVDIVVPRFRMSWTLSGCNIHFILVWWPCFTGGRIGSKRSPYRDIHSGDTYREDFLPLSMLPVISKLR